MILRTSLVSLVLPDLCSTTVTTYFAVTQNVLPEPHAATGNPQKLALSPRLADRVSAQTVSPKIIRGQEV